MYVLRGLDESFDNIFPTIIEKIISERIIIDDAKTLLLNHESKIKRRRQAKIYPVPSFNLSVATPTNRNQNVVHNSQNDQAQASLQQHMVEL